MIGKEILNYVITDVIGQGGMGVVYAAVNKFIREQKVAIKMINHDMLNDFTRDRLEQEAHRLASLDHPNIVSLINFHKDEKGNVFLIMEYAEGVSIDKYLNEIHGLVVEDDICPLFDPILDGIGYAHRHRSAEGQQDPIIHCDIKPANIIIYPGDSPRVHILDFGIAQIVSDQDNSSRLVMGTPSYMSPEQVKGQRLDERSDIYSLGVLLHQMLTGNVPYDTTTLTEQEINEKVIAEPLPRMRTFYKYVSDAVQQVVDKATAKCPDDRYASCAEFKRALHKAVYPYRMPLWTKVAIAALVALIVGAGTWLWDYNRTKVTYYKDYAEQWGVPQGIGRLSSSAHGHAEGSYMFVSHRGRLLRVAHVNSSGHLIEDNAAEHSERPVCQEFVYTDDGRVSRVKVKDCCGKVIYVKSYNEKGNLVTFQYDDENNTERVLPNMAVSQGWLESDADEGLGKISRWSIEYDSDGYVKSEMFRNVSGLPAGDANGIYGRTYVRDSKGRPTEVHYVDADGRAHPTRWGLAIKTFEYDSDDNWTQSAYLTVDRQDALDAADGVTVRQMEYDKYGNLVKLLFVRGNGKPMLRKRDLIAGMRYSYDDRGNCLQTEYLGLNHKPTYNKEKECSIQKYEYDPNGYGVKNTSCNAAGDISMRKSGYAIAERTNNEYGKALEIWYKDKAGAIVGGTDGCAGKKYEYDSVGNMTKVVYYDIERKPISGNLYTYDSRGFMSQWTHLGSDLKPEPDEDNLVRAHYEYDTRGNLVKTAYFEADGVTPRPDNEGISAYTFTYDDNGNSVEQCYFNDKGQPTLSLKNSFAKKTRSYDDYGYVNSIRYYNASGQLTLVEGIAGYDWINDKNGNCLEQKPIGLNGTLAPGRHILKMTYDSLGNEIEKAYFGNSGPVLNSDGLHRVTMAYNSRGQVIKQCYYDTKGKLTLDKDHVAIVVFEYNDRGDEIKQSFYGSDQKPVTSTEGFSSLVKEYDELGNKVKTIVYGPDGQLTDPKKLVPVIVYKYDETGNEVYRAYQDGNGHLIASPKYKFAILRMEYDSHNNNTSCAYFDTADKPTLGINGVHKVVMAFNDQDKETEEAYFGKELQPIVIKGNYHKVRYTYDNRTGRLVEEAFYGTNGKPVNYYGEWHKRVTTYSNNGTPLTAKYYTTGGSLLATERWNGKQWI